MTSDLVESVEKAISEAEKINEKFSCFITICGEEARKRAKELSKSQKSEATSLLLGKIISVKDAICTRGIRTTAGSTMLTNYVPPFNATVINKIGSACGIVIGKTAMDHYGFGTFCTNVGAGMSIPKNPHDLQRAAGGSSGGAGVATYAFSPSSNHIALAESTGGSISAPAAFCGVVGFTPSYGKISRYGLIDYANSLDKIGTMGKNVNEAEILANVLFGKDDKDESSQLQEKKSGKKVKKFGIIKEMLVGVDKKILDVFWKQVEKISKDLKITYEEVSFPLIDYATASYYIIATAEASSNLARYTGMRYGQQEEISGSFSEHFAKIRSKYFSEEEKRRIILGTFVRTAGYKEKYYMKALKVREKIKEEFDLLFKKYDVLLTPTMPIIAPHFDEISKLKPIEIYALDSCTIPPNLAGIPHLSIPMGKVNNMPVGMQVMCGRWEENTLFEFGKQIEEIL